MKFLQSNFDKGDSSLGAERPNKTHLDNKGLNFYLFYFSYKKFLYLKDIYK